MKNVNRYIKIAKDTVIKPSENIEEKIIDRISHIDESDKKLLDEGFIDYFKKSNSRVYLFAQKIKDNPGAFAFLGIILLFTIIFIAFIIRVILGEERAAEGNNLLSSSKNNSKNK